MEPPSPYEIEFWNERNEYHSFVERFERNVELTHPPCVSSNRLAMYVNCSRWGATAVDYYEYRGPRIPRGLQYSEH